MKPFYLLMFLSAILLLFADPITPPSLAEFLRGDAVAFIMMILGNSVVLYCNFIMYCDPENREEPQKNKASTNARIAFALYIIFILSCIIPDLPSRTLNYITAFSVAWSTLELSRFKRKRDSLRHFRKVRELDETLLSFFGDSKTIRVFEKEFTLESLRETIRSHTDYSQDIVEYIEKKIR